jgi:hypothetical protein
MASRSQTFQYPSTAGPDDLRLLFPSAISPRVLHFTIVKAPRTAAPRYIAVSYTWGDTAASEFIFLNDQRFPVRPNLWSALYYLGQHARRSGKYLWVDAICIDQNCAAERNAQARRMDDTYKRAAQVSVWLGLPSIQNYITIPDSLLPIKTVEISDFDWFENAEDLSNRPYWSRVWVIQEFLLGQRVIMHSGNAEISSDDFQELLCSKLGISQYNADFRTPGRAANKYVASFRSLPLVMARHVDKHPDFLQSLYDLLIGYHRAECKEPRDRVFGLLGLVTRDERGMLERFFPDYTMAEDHVRIIALAHVMQYNGLDRVDASKVTPKSNELFLGLWCYVEVQKEVANSTGRHSRI